MQKTYGSYRFSTCLSFPVAVVSSRVLKGRLAKQEKMQELGDDEMHIFISWRAYQVFVHDASVVLSVLTWLHQYI